MMRRGCSEKSVLSWVEVGSSGKPGLLESGRAAWTAWALVPRDRRSFKSV